MNDQTGKAQETSPLQGRQISPQKGVLEEYFRRARKAQRRARFADAVRWYEKAVSLGGPLNSEKSAELKELRRKGAQEEARQALSEAEKRGDLAGTLEWCEKLLEFGDLLSARESILGKKAVLTARFGRFEESYSIFNARKTLSLRERYAFGYALAGQGKLLEAFKVWQPLVGQTTSPAFAKQWEELSRKVLGLATTRMAVENPEDSVTLVKSLMPSHPKLLYLRWQWCLRLWEQERYEEVASVAPALGTGTSKESILFQAKLLYRLAEKEPRRYLGDLIPYWVTATHLHDGSGQVSVEISQRTLEEVFEALLERYQHQAEKAESAKLRKLFVMERDVIRKLASILPLHSQVFPCSPVLAHALGISEKILSLLDTLVPPPEIRPYFTPYGKALLLAECGFHSEAIKALPPLDLDPAGKTERQRVFILSGIQKALEGESQITRYFSVASSLLKQDAAIRARLIELAQTEAAERACLSLAESYEALAKEINDIPFREAAARILGLAGKRLFEEQNTVVAKHYFERALKLNPSDKVALAQKDEIQTRLLFDNLERLFFKGKFGGSAQLAVDSKSEELTTHFFTLVSELLNEMDEDVQMSDEDKLEVGYRLAQASEAVDKNHPVFHRLKNALRHWERDSDEP